MHLVNAIKLVENPAFTSESLLYRRALPEIPLFLRNFVFLRMRLP
jgi:hypothetical protein